jgi:hypothetical protein
MIRSTVMAIALAALVGVAPSAWQQSQEKAAQENTPNTRPPGQPVNIKLDVTIVDQREGQTAAPRTVTMMIADRSRGQFRSGGSGGQMLNVDARPEIGRDSRMRVELNLDYRGVQSENDKTPPMLTQSIVSVVDDGKPLVVTQWAEMGSTRTIRVELRAAVQK